MKLFCTFIIILFVFVSIKADTTLVKKAKETIAVNTLGAIGITKDEAEVLTAKLRSELINTAGFKVLERGEMDEILKEQQFQATGACDDKACLVEMGQLLGVSHMVAGSIGKVGNTYSITVSLFSVKTGEIYRDVSHSYQGDIDGLLQTEMNTVVRKLARLEIKKKKSRTWLWVTLGVIGAGSAGLTIYALSKDDEKEKFDLKVKW